MNNQFHPLIPANIKGIIFDIDGTIADTMPLHYQASQIVCNAKDFDFPLAYFYAKAGIPTHKVFQMLMVDLNLPFDGYALADEKEAIFQTLIPQVKPLNPAAEVAEAYLGKLPMALGTGATTEVGTQTIKAIGMENYFKAIVGCDMVKYGKPAPDTFLLAAQLMGVEPKDCIVFEDGQPGIDAAIAAGMQYVDVRKWTMKDVILN